MGASASRWFTGLAGLVLVIASLSADGGDLTAARREIAMAPTLPGAVEVRSSPARPLDDGAGGHMPVDLDRWWTAPGTMEQATAFLRTHPPTGMTVDGSGQATDHGMVDCLDILYGRAVPDGPPYLLDLSVTPYRGGVAVRANVQDSGRFNPGINAGGPSRPDTGRGGSRTAPTG